MRTVSSPAQTEILKTVTQPIFLVEIQFASGLVRLSTGGDLTWNSLIWVGANFSVDGFGGDGRTARISIWDPVAAIRTAALTNGGCRNRAITIWQLQAAAVGASDANVIFSGVGDSVQVAKGRVMIACARLSSVTATTPQLRISPANGFNFLAAPGKKIYWGTTTITISGRVGGGYLPPSAPLGNIPL